MSTISTGCWADSALLSKTNKPIELHLIPYSRRDGRTPGFELRSPVSRDRNRLSCQITRQIDYSKQHRDPSQASFRLDEPVGRIGTYRRGADRGRYLEGTRDRSDTQQPAHQQE